MCKKWVDVSLNPFLFSLKEIPMISADLHLHTSYSHGLNSPFEMHKSAEEKGLGLIGFTEHSPRPLGYDYTREYRDHLTAHFPDYIREVSLLRDNCASSCKVLLGLEMDWLPDESDFVREACFAHDYDYIIGSVHFLKHWGFDDQADLWREASKIQIFLWYEEYFQHWLSMIQSGLFQIAAHPDLIKIYSVNYFHDWIEQPQSRDLVYSCLKALKASEMAMEISSAGMRKACREFYPCPQIMRMAEKLGLNISLASDAHNINDIASFFPELAAYARKFGFDRQIVYNHGQIDFLPF